jgi:hypothetical protein
MTDSIYKLIIDGVELQDTIEYFNHLEFQELVSLINEDMMILRFMSEELRRSLFLKKDIFAKEHRDGRWLSFMKKQSAEMCEIALSYNLHSIVYVDDSFRTHKFYKQHIARNPTLIMCINRTPELVDIAVKSSYRLLDDLEKQPSDICIASIENNIHTIVFVREPEKVVLDCFQEKYNEIRNERQVINGRIKKGVYRHYKGTEYYVSGTTRNATNGHEPSCYVLYSTVKDYTEDKCKNLWVRKLSEFKETVFNPDYIDEGVVKINRFTFVRTNLFQNTK